MLGGLPRESCGQPGSAVLRSEALRLHFSRGESLANRFTLHSQKSLISQNADLLIDKRYSCQEWLWPAGLTL